MNKDYMARISHALTHPVFSSLEQNKREEADHRLHTPENKFRKHARQLCAHLHKAIRCSSLKKAVAHAPEPADAALQAETNERPPLIDNRFNKMLQRIKTHSEYQPAITTAAPYGIFRGRQIIGEHTEINGGIYVGVNAHEAVVVDEKYGLLKKVYDELMIKYVKAHGTRDKAAVESRIVEIIVDFVKEKLSYLNDEQVQRTLARKTSYTPDCKMALDVFLEHGTGTSRHQVLLAAYLLEKLKEKGLIKGKVYLDAHCKDPSKDRERLVYSSSAGDLYIFAPGAVE